MGLALERERSGFNRHSTGKVTSESGVEVTAMEKKYARGAFCRDNSDA